MKKQRAFTLIELLAVIVILAIISLIAIPIILNIIDKAKQSSLESSAKGLAESAKLYYFNNLEAVKEEVVFDCNQNGCHNAKGEKLEFSGKIESGKLVLSEKGKALVCVDDGEKYAYIKETTTSGTGLCGDYEDEEIVILDKNGKRNGRIILSGNNEKISYPNTKELEIITNLSNGELSVTSSNEDVVTATIEGNKIRLQPVLPTGTSTITVTSGEIGNYKETTTTFTVTVELGILDITVNGYNGLYDEEAHSITVASNGANITYATEENGVYSETNPTYTDVGTYTVWYKVEKYGYEVVVDSATINISPTNLGLALPKTEDTLVGTLIEQKTIQYQVINKGGELSVTSSNPDVATATITQEGLLTVTSGLTPGAVVITVTSGEKLPNYVESTARLELNVEVTCGYDSGQTWDFAYTGSKSDFAVPCNGTYKLEVWGAQGGTGYTRSKATLKTVTGGSYSSLSLSSSNFTRTNDTYYFSTSGTPNNLGVASSTATTTWTATTAIDVKVEITYVTQTNYDKVSVSIGGVTKISSASGSGTQSVRGSLDVGDTIVVKYVKSAATDADGESVTVKFYKETTAGTESSSYGSWGLSASQSGGKGGYSVGTTSFEMGTNLYVYVGGKGDSSSSTTSNTAVSGGFNGGGTSYNKRYSNIMTNGGGGGGATDIRIGTDSLYSRVIVAGGGGGGAGSSDSTKYGGGESGGSSTAEYAATISAPGTNGSFGNGASTSSTSSYKYAPGAGGGGWYGGGAHSSGSTSSSTYRKYNGGGSGWIYTLSNFETWNVGDAATAANYLLDSKYYLIDATTTAGNVSFTSPTGTAETGHSGNGYARITLLSLDESN